MSWFFIITIFIQIVIQKTQAQGCSCSRPVCTRINERDSSLLTPEQIQKSNLDLINKSWKLQEPKLTIKGNALKSAILNMSTSDNPKWRAVSLMTTWWIWSHILHLDSKPNMCNFARLINETVHHDNYDNCPSLNKAINILPETILDAAKYEAEYIYKNSNCKHEPFKHSKQKCRGDGLVSLTKDLWESESDNYPEEFEKAALDLYDSNDYIDQVMGVITTACITRSLYEYLNHLNIDIFFPIYMAQFNPKTHRDCCKILKDDIDKLLKKVPQAALVAAKGAKKSIGCEIETYSHIEL